MKIYSLFLGVLFWFSLISCKQDEIVSNEMLNQLSTIENKQNSYISEFLFYTLFVKIDNDKYYMTDGRELYDIYNNNYREDYSNYDDFLYEILNQKTALKEDMVNVNKTFILRHSLMNKSINNIVKDYSINKVKNVYRLNASLKSQDELGSLLLLFFYKKILY